MTSGWILLHQHSLASCQLQCCWHNGQTDFSNNCHGYRKEKKGKAAIEIDLRLDKSPRINQPLTHIHGTCFHTIIHMSRIAFVTHHGTCSHTNPRPSQNCTQKPQQNTGSACAKNTHNCSSRKQLLRQMTCMLHEISLGRQ